MKNKNPKRQAEDEAEGKFFPPTILHTFFYSNIFSVPFHVFLFLVIPRCVGRRVEGPPAPLAKKRWTQNKR